MVPIGAAAGLRFYTPSEQLKALYASDFEKADFPCEIVSSDSSLFAKFLYKAAESQGNLDSVLGDFKRIADSVPQLPIFWERTCKIEELEPFQSLSEPVLFTLEWMQSNGMLEQIADVAEIYEMFVNAKLRRVTVKVYVGEDRSPETLEKAKAVADGIIQSKPALSGFSPVYKIIVDHTIMEGFLLDVQGEYHNEAKGHGKAGADVAAEVDYLNVPLPHLPPTKWKENVENEGIQAYLKSLALYDAEELKCGV